MTTRRTARWLVPALLLPLLAVAPTASAAATPDPLPDPHLQAAQADSNAPIADARPPSQPDGVLLYDCADAGDGGQCGTLRVPLDRTRPNGAKVTLFFFYYRQRQPVPSQRALMLSLGGPGASITTTGLAPFFRGVFDPVLGSRGLIMVDQRGVGRSQAIDCPALERKPDFGSIGILGRTAACVRQLGQRATMYGSGDVALDMDAIRDALGITKLDLYGASYAGEDIEAYALRFPHRLGRVVLDSPVSTSVFGSPGSRFDDFASDAAFAMPRVADQLCARSRSCSVERADARADLAWLTARLRAAPITGTANDLTGTPRTVNLTENSLAWKVLLAGDNSFTALSEIAAAAAALRAGDSGPLLRLAAEAETPGFEPDPAEVFSDGDNAARFCVDATFPWDTSASLDVRRRQWQQAKAALPADRFLLFSKDGWLQRPSAPIAPDPCIVWPGPTATTPPAVPPGSHFPRRVPVLILTGDVDLVIPMEDSQPIAGLWGNSTYVQTPNAGHTTVFWAYGCLVPIVQRFIATGHAGDTGCAASNAETTSFPAVGRFPVTAADAVEATPAESTDASTHADRQVATVVAATLTDAMRRGFGPAAISGGAGLRGGTFAFSCCDGGGGDVQLDGAQWTTDVAVSGAGRYDFASQTIGGTLTVDGPGAEDGTLTVDGVWYGFGPPTTVLRVRGTLGGREVDVAVPAS